MAELKDTTVAAVMEQLMAQGPDGMAEVFTSLFNLAMRFERERFLGAAHYERTPGRRGYANGFKPKTIDTQAGTLALEVPKTAGAEEPFYPASLERGPAVLARGDAGGGRDVREGRLDPRRRSRARRIRDREPVLKPGQPRRQVARHRTRCLAQPPPGRHPPLYGLCHLTHLKNTKL